MFIKLHALFAHPVPYSFFLFPIFPLLPEGPFQSDALLVPEGCLFDHIHNASRCWPFIRWNQTGAAACQDRNMQMRSFAMLLPCGISLFSGVEFVCCPKHFKGKCVLLLRISYRGGWGDAAAVGYRPHRCVNLCTGSVGCSGLGDGAIWWNFS